MGHPNCPEEMKNPPPITMDAIIEPPSKEGSASRGETNHRGPRADGNRCSSDISSGVIFSPRGSPRCQDASETLAIFAPPPTPLVEHRCAPARTYTHTHTHRERERER
jgi:hypothetical protein